MSIEQINRAYRVQVGSPTVKLVLLMIADAVADNGVGWVPVSRIVKWSELGESSVRAALPKLEAMGFLKVEKQKGDFRTNRYTLDLPDWRKMEAETGGIRVQQVDHNGAGGGPLDERTTVQELDPEGAADGGGRVQQVDPYGAGGGPNSSYPSKTHLNPSLCDANASARERGPEFPVGFPESMRAPLTDWWHYKAEEGRPFKRRGWASVLQAAQGYEVAIVAATVKQSMENGWPGVHFWKVAAEMRASLGQQNAQGGNGAENREKKEGGPPKFDKQTIEPAGFPWQALAIAERGEAPSLPWELQTVRFRREMRTLWASLPVERRAEVETLANREKKEAAA
jgi:hypothetical protein